MRSNDHHLHEVLKTAFDSSQDRAPIRVEWDMHDKTQFELNFYYSLAGNTKGRGRVYDVKMTYFLPHSIGLTSDSYRASDFYGHIFTFQMIEAPRTSDSPEQIVLKSLEQLLSKQVKEESLGKKAVYDVKIFGCMIDRQFDVLARKVDSSKDNKGIPSDGIRQEFQDIIDRIHFFRHRYVENISKFTSDELREAVMGVDEFLSNQIEFRVLLFFGHLLGVKGKVELGDLNDEEGMIVGLHAQRVKLVLDDEVYYRKKLGYMNLRSDSKPREKEEFYFRHSLLKKFVRECLYIQSTSKRKERFHRNITAAMGASLAALWAALAEVQRLEIMLNRNTTLNYIPLVGIAVVVYVFKDRIKDLSKEFLYSRLSSFFPDLRTELVYRTFSSLGERWRVHLGQTTEVVRMTKWDKLTSAVKDLRNHKRLASFIGMDMGELIFEVNRTFKTGDGDYQKAAIMGLRDSFRFDIDHLLSRLRNPKKRLLLYDLESGGERVKAQRTYHVNVIIEARVRSAKNAVRNAKKSNLAPNLFLKLRLVLNKDGLVRVEEIHPVNPSEISGEGPETSDAKKDKDKKGGRSKKKKSAALEDSTTTPGK